MSVENVLWEEPDFEVLETSAEASAYAYRK